MNKSVVNHSRDVSNSKDVDKIKDASNSRDPNNIKDAKSSRDPSNRTDARKARTKEATGISTAVWTGATEESLKSRQGFQGFKHQ
jgi:hypothetical protein